MSKQSIENYAEQLSETARALLSATSDAAESTVQQARIRLEAALDSGKNAVSQAGCCAAKSLGAADGVLRDNPYVFAGAAFVLGLLIALTVKPCRK